MKMKDKSKKTLVNTRQKEKRKTRNEKQIDGYAEHNTTDS